MTAVGKTIASTVNVSKLMKMVMSFRGHLLTGNNKVKVFDIFILVLECSSVPMGRITKGSG